MEVTERHRERAREWLSANVWPNTGREQARTLDPAIESLAALLAEVEGEAHEAAVRECNELLSGERADQSVPLHEMKALQARIATLEAALRTYIEAWNDGAAGDELDEMLFQLGRAVGGVPSALKAMLVRSACLGYWGGVALCEAAPDGSTASDNDTANGAAEAIAERVLGGG